MSMTAVSPDQDIPHVGGGPKTRLVRHPTTVALATSRVHQLHLLLAVAYRHHHIDTVHRRQVFFRR
ncbi:MAG: hypothetical protein OSB03_18470, partial [Vicinamibacterales bacterium]|nr:hypothetical protein [Vicinamibacterales bacterium]